MSEIHKQHVLRYAQIAFKQQQNRASDEELVEAQKLRDELEMTHEAILGLAQRNLLPED